MPARISPPGGPVRVHSRTRIRVTTVSTPPAPAFAPEDVVGAVACWVADDCSAVGDGNAVSSWVDRIGSFDAAQATGTKQPLYRSTGLGGQPSVDFDGTDDLLRYAAADAVSTAVGGHVFVVCRPDDLSTARDAVTSSDEASTTRYIEAVYTQASGALGVNQRNNDTIGSWISASSAAAIATDQLLEIASSGTAWVARVNGTSITLNDQGGGPNNGDWFGDTSARDNFAIGARKTTSESRFWDGDIAMVLVVDGAISTDDRAALNAMVTAKYGITLA